MASAVMIGWRATLDTHANFTSQNMAVIVEDALAPEVVKSHRAASMHGSWSWVYLGSVGVVN